MSSVVNSVRKFAALPQPVEDDLVHRRAARTVRVGQPRELVDLRARPQLSLVLCRVARQPDARALGMTVRLRFEDADWPQAAGAQADVQLFGDLADQALLVRLVRLALAAGEIP